MNNKRWWYFPQFGSFTAVSKLQHHSAHSYAPTIKAEYEFCHFVALLRALVQTVLVFPFRLFMRHKLSADTKCKWWWWWWWWWWWRRGWRRSLFKFALVGAKAVKPLRNPTTTTTTLVIIVTTTTTTKIKTNKTAASAANITNDNLLEVLEHSLGCEMFRTNPDRP
jgi:hypothetical protein